MIEQALRGLGPEELESSSIRIYILFRKDDVLRLRVCHVGEEAEVSFLFAGVFDGPSLPPIQAELARYEMYTLPGKVPRFST